ncbi:hypothetical protein MKOR_17180 [Mycolicibacillus koreensis]|nr:hypothetical protein MKOR_17180 [Mycolicibacillus koreensis]
MLLGLDGIVVDAVVASVADIWRGFGWHVEPRDSEMVARTPDGYTLIIDGTGVCCTNR